MYVRAYVNEPLPRQPTAYLSLSLCLPTHIHTNTGTTRQLIPVRSTQLGLIHNPTFLESTGVEILLCERVNLEIQSRRDGSPATFKRGLGDSHHDYESELVHQMAAVNCEICHSSRDINSLFNCLGALLDQVHWMPWIVSCWHRAGIWRNSSLLLPIRRVFILLCAPSGTWVSNQKLATQLQFSYHLQSRQHQPQCRTL